MPTAQRGSTFPELVDIMDKLLAPDGCPWDREQTLQTLEPFLIEEAYEVLEAIDAGDAPEHCEELGDLLFQIVFQAALRAREGKFGIDDVVRAIATKMIRRHPHVFGDAKVKDSEEVLANWGKLKAAEHKEKGITRRALEGVPVNLPALLRAQRIGEKAAAVGFDWPDVAGVREKVDEELREIDEAVAGRRPCADRARGRRFVARGFSASRPSSASRPKTRCARRCADSRVDSRRWRIASWPAASKSRDTPLEELDRIWNEVKKVQPPLPKK